MLDTRKKAQYITRKFVNHLMKSGKKEKAEKHKGEELKSLAKQAKAIKSGKKSPEKYAEEETAEYMKKGGRAKKKK